MEFMLETICDIKNNRKRPKEETVQHTRIKKWLQKVVLVNMYLLKYFDHILFSHALDKSMNCTKVNEPYPT